MMWQLKFGSNVFVIYMLVVVDGEKVTFLNNIYN